MQIQWNPDSAVVLDFMSFLSLALFCGFQPSIHKNNIKPKLYPYYHYIFQILTMEIYPILHLQCSILENTFAYECFWTSHDWAQPIAYTHSHAHSYTWVAAAICFRTNLINNIYTMIWIVYKHGNPFINILDQKYGQEHKTEGI
jgi:hypothetical protein